MVCYARPAGRLAVLLVVAWLVFSAPVSHFFGSAAILVTVAAAVAVAALAAVTVFAVFLSVRRRRAAAGGCVGCRFRCQHAMAERPGRLWLVTTADRRPPAPAWPGSPGRPGVMPVRSAPVLLPMPALRSAATAPATADDPAGACGVPAPRWPDRPAHRAAPVAHVRQRERIGSPA